MITGNTTISRGIIKEVTKRGMVSVAHNKDAYIKMAKQFFCKESCVNGVKLKVNNAMKHEVINRNFSREVWPMINCNHCLGGKCMSSRKVRESVDGAMIPAPPLDIAMDSVMLALGRN